MKTIMKKQIPGIVLGNLVAATVLADAVVLDDQIVDGSICAGQDCVNGESFGFDTLRLKENNLRIRFVDTSSSSSFPSNDWQLTANDTSNGGANKFSIDDIDSGRTPFTIEAGAKSHSLYLDSSGRLGLGTSTPLVDAHLVSGDSPALRIEQDASNGYNKQSWDLSGNEAGFFIRDATNSGTLPLRIRTGASSSAVDIAAGGFVGINNEGATARLDVLDTNNAQQNTASQVSGFKVTNASATENSRALAAFSNNGEAGFILADTSADGDEWSIDNKNGALSLQRNQSVLLNLDDNGNLATTGEICANKDGIKQCIGTVASSKGFKNINGKADGAQILNKISQLAIYNWSYKDADTSVLHVGPLAEDFHASFGLNGDVTDRISTVDLTGVALSAIKELNKQLKEKDQQLQLLKQEMAEIKRLIKR